MELDVSSEIYAHHIRNQKCSKGGFKRVETSGSEEPMLKLKLQYFGHLMQRADSLEKTLMLGNIEGRRRGDNRG